MGELGKHNKPRTNKTFCSYSWNTPEQASVHLYCGFLGFPSEVRYTYRSKDECLTGPDPRVLWAVCVVRVERDEFSILLTLSGGRQRLGHVGSDQWAPSYLSRGPSSVGLGFEAQGGSSSAVAHLCTCMSFNGSQGQSEQRTLNESSVQICILRAHLASC